MKIRIASLFFASLSLMAVATSLSSAADLYKCVKDGATAYQSAPCEGASQATQMSKTETSPLLGCYASTMSGLERFQLRRAGSEGFQLLVTSGAASQPLKLKIATPEELRDLGKAFSLQLSEGLSVDWPKGTPNQKPLGVFKGRDASGKDVTVLYMFFASGPVAKMACG